MCFEGIGIGSAAGGFTCNGRAGNTEEQARANGKPAASGVRHQRNPELVRRFIISFCYCCGANLCHTFIRVEPVPQMEGKAHAVDDIKRGFQFRVPVEKVV